MSTKQKLIERFKTLPSDFTFDEVVRLFACYGFHISNKGGTSGSRVAFKRGEDEFDMHRPHPSNTIKQVYLRQIYYYLKQKHLL